MGWLFISVCLIYITYSFFLRKKIYEPTVVFTLVWGVIVLLLQFNYLKFDAVFNYTYLIMLVGVSSFIFGGLIAINNDYIIVLKKNFVSHRLNEKIFNMLIYLYFLFSIKPFLIAIKLFFSDGFYAIRYLLRDEILENGIISIAFNYYCQPFLVVFIIMTVVNYFSDEQNKAYLLYMILGIVMNVVIAGGRFSIMYLALSIILILSIKKEIFNDYILNFIEKSKEKKAKGLVFLTLFVFILITISRGADIVNNVYTYVCGCVPFMQHLLKTNSYDLTFGLTSFNGFIRPFFVFLRLVGVSRLPHNIAVVEMILLKADEPYFISNDVIYNSFVTSFYAPYIDGGLLGVGIIHFIFGFIANTAFKNLNKMDTYSISLFIIIDIMVFFSFFRLLTCSYMYAMSFIYLRLCYMKTKINN